MNFPRRIKTGRGNASVQEKNSLNKENYHPASVLSHVSNIFEKTIYELINNYKESYYEEVTYVIDTKEPI